MNAAIRKIRQAIAADASNRAFAELGYEPLFVADERARLVVIGHAPGLQAQEKQLAWGDLSGERLIDWLGITEATFRNPAEVALIPMDFYYQGKGASGDKPPRKAFADTWHPQLLECMPEVELVVLTGQYAVKHYLGGDRQKNLTETVRHFSDYLPHYFPLVHPSPLNNRWLAKNGWFAAEVLPALKARVAEVLSQHE